uniref:Uncharacterized protein n=1 Tax=Schistocephalus solidus TaxID=70667 RepID=A0A0V0J9W2_SCHSO
MASANTQLAKVAVTQPATQIPVTLPSVTDHVYQTLQPPKPVHSTSVARKGSPALRCVVLTFPLPFYPFHHAFYYSYLPFLNLIPIFVNISSPVPAVLSFR